MAWAFEGILVQTADEVLRLVSTDGYRLAVCDVPVLERDAADFRVPVRAVLFRDSIEALGRNSDRFSLTIGSGRLSIRAGGTPRTLSSIEGEYPNHRQPIPVDPPSAVECEAAEMVRALERAADATTADEPVRLRGGAGELGVIVDSEGGGQTRWSVAGRLEGRPFEALFNPRFLADGFGHVDGERVRIEAGEALEPLLIKDTMPGCLYLVMPVKPPE